MNSLRARLVLLPTALLLLGMGITIAFILADAPERVNAELASGLRLGRLLVVDALRDLAAAPDPPRAVAHFADTLPHVRHVRFALLPVEGGTPLLLPEPARHEPAWFYRLLAPPPRIELFPLVIGGREVGLVAMRSYPGDEIAEIWQELQLLVSVMLGLGLAIAVLLIATVSLSLRPLRLLTTAFDRLEHGQFTPLPALRVAELRGIGRRFNSLGATLQRVTADNHLLIDRMMSLQEAERKELGRELHDEFGPALFGIRADAACILRAAESGSAALPEIAERARSITALADGIQQVNRQIIDRLRPLILEQVGLAEALRQLVDWWAARHPGIAWTIAADDAVDAADETTAVTLYRIVQEALTNAARHAGAGTVAVRIRLHHAANGTVAADAIELEVNDDGRGLPPATRFGFGLLGMGERVRRLHGSWSVRGTPGRGTCIAIVLPRHSGEMN